MRKLLIRRHALTLVLATLGLVIVLAAGVATTIRGARGATPIPPAKQALLDRIQQLRIDALKSPIPDVHPQSAVSVETTPESWPSGIFQSSEAPFPSALYTIQNEWQDVVLGQHVQVYAGVLTAHPMQGVLIAQTVSMDLSTVKDMAYPGPVQDGPLHIVSVAGTKLTVASAHGQTFIFDVVTRSLTS